MTSLDRTGPPVDGHAATEVRGPAHPPTRSLSLAGLVVGGGMAVGNGMNYLFQVLMSRLLGPASFGAMGALLAVSFILSVPGVALQTVVARHTALRDRDGIDVADLWLSVTRAVLWIGTGLALVAALAAPILMRFLHLGSAAPALWLAFSLLPLPALPAILGMLQGRERFWHLAIALLAGALGKLALGALFVATGFGVSGAVAGAGAGSLLGVGVGVWLTRRDLRRGRGRAGVAWRMRREVAAAWYALFALFLAVNLDIVLARHFLPRPVSGLYAVGSIVAKVTYWAPRFVVVVVFPRLITSTDRRRLLTRAALSVVALSAVVVGAVGVGSHALLGGVFGRGYEGLGSSLWLFAGIGTTFALVHLLLFSGFAVADWRMSRALTAAVALNVTFIVTLFHHSIDQIATVVLLSALGLLVVGVAFEYRRGGKRSREPIRPARTVGAGADAP